MAERLLDFASPLDVGLLDKTVDAFHGAGSNEQVMGEQGGGGTRVGKQLGSEGCVGVKLGSEAGDLDSCGAEGVGKWVCSVVSRDHFC